MNIFTKIQQRFQKVDEIFDEFIKSLLDDWPPDLIFLNTDPASSNHVFIADRPFFVKYVETILHFDESEDVLRIIESFLDILPEPDTVHGQDRPPYEESLLGKMHSYLIVRYPNAKSLQSLTPFFDYIVSKMILTLLWYHSIYHCICRYIVFYV